MECIKNEEVRILTSEETLDLGRKSAKDEV